MVKKIKIYKKVRKKRKEKKNTCKIIKEENNNNKINELYLVEMNYHYH